MQNDTRKERGGGSYATVEGARAGIPKHCDPGDEYTIFRVDELTGVGKGVESGQCRLGGDANEIGFDVVKRATEGPLIDLAKLPESN